MSDQRFSDRLKRIEKRARGGPKADLMAGVGSIDDARQAAITESYPVLTMIVSAVTGFAALYYLQKQIGVEALQALLSTSDGAARLLQESPLLAASVGWLGLIGLALLAALVIRRIGASFRTFGFAGTAGAIGALAYEIADPVVLMGYIEAYVSAI